jgi:hypothetical protein
MRRKKQAHQKMWCNLLPPGSLPPLLAAHAADPALSEAIVGAEGSHSAFWGGMALDEKVCCVQEADCGEAAGMGSG